MIPTITVIAVKVKILFTPVSYTHLDVYKRQAVLTVCVCVCVCVCVLTYVKYGLNAEWTKRVFNSIVWHLSCLGHVSRYFFKKASTDYQL